MAVHELATNAIKYGALPSRPATSMSSWSVADGRFRWSWRERGGPTVVPPKHKGFGSRMIERALALQLSGKVAIDYGRRRGVHHRRAAGSDPGRAARSPAASGGWRKENRSPLIRRRSRHGSGPVLPQNVPCRSKRIVLMLVSLGSIS